VIRAVSAAVLLAVLVAGCAEDEPSTKPTFGGGSEPSGASAGELADLKAAAKIEDCPASGDVEPPAKGALPDLELDCLGGGRSARLSALAGTPTVINLWASWCKECRDELPLLARADREYGDRVQFIGIDVKDAAPEAALRLADQSGVVYPQLVDRAGRTQGPLRFSGLPQTVLVDAQGRMVATERTPFRSYAEVKAAIRRHLGVTP
jgi:cytochrome c biogenesis protein CcmG/thiol:disulfide interchange protein DsbE